MTKTQTRRAFLASVAALVICVAMLAGSTFAWFTDSASVSVNAIKSGTLDVALEAYIDGEWVNAEGITLDFIKADDENEEILWEPGATYNLPKLRITNKGKLALKYDLAITGINGDEKLDEAIEWTITTTTDYVNYGNHEETVITYEQNAAGGGWKLHPASVADKSIFVNYAYVDISGTMDPAAGNEYQDLTIRGISVTVVATQTDFEKDSNSPMYDLNATYPYPLETSEALEDALAEAKEGEVITASNITDEVVIPATAKGITLQFVGKSPAKISLADGAEDITLVGADIAAANSGDKLIQLNGDHGLVTIKNLKLTGVENVKAGHAVSGGNGTELVVDGCNIANIGYGVQDTFSGFESLTVTNSTFENTVSWAILNQGATASVTIDGCTFKNCQAGILKSTGMQANGTLVFTNNTMTGCKEHNPYGLIQLKNQDTCNITWSGNTFDGAEMANPFVTE